MIRKSFFFLLICALFSQSTFAQKKYAVVVGVSNYMNISKLNYCDDDAYRFYAFLKSPKGGVDSENILCIIDEAATKKNILSSMHKTFSKAGPNDMLILYFSGHGGDEQYLCPYDMNPYQGSTALMHKEIKEVFKRYKAKYKVVYTDACYSGQLGINQDGGSYGNTSTANNSDTNVVVFMSSKGQETSEESSKLRQGYYTYYLIKGLEGAADKNKNGKVTLGEIFPYVKANVSNASNYRQTPTIRGSAPKNLIISKL